MYPIAEKNVGECVATEWPNKLDKIMISTRINDTAKTLAMVSMVAASIAYITIIAHRYHHLDVSPRFAGKCLSLQALRISSLARRRSAHHRPYIIPPPTPSIIPPSISWLPIMRPCIAFLCGHYVATRRARCPALPGATPRPVALIMQHWNRAFGYRVGYLGSQRA